MCTQIYTVFGSTKAKIVRFTMRKSVIHDFQARSSKILFLCDSLFTRHFQERNHAYSWELPWLSNPLPTH